VEVELDAKLGEIRVFQVLFVKQAPTDPRREMTREVVRTWSAEYDAVEEGQKLRFPIYYTHNPSQRGEIARLESLCGAHLPLPVHATQLWDALTEQLNDILLRYFPGPAFDEGTLGALLASGGSWTKGLSARSDPFELRLESTFLNAYRIRTSGCWIDYGFVLVLERDGVELFRGSTDTHWQSLGDGPDAPSIEALLRGDNESAVLTWAALPTSEAAKPALLQALQAMVEGLSQGSSIHGRQGLQALLCNAITPPRTGGFWDWLQSALRHQLEGFNHSFLQDGSTLTLTIDEVFEPRASLPGFGQGSVHIVLSADNDAVDIWGEGSSFDAGTLSKRSLELAGPRDAAEQQGLEQLIATYAHWLARHIEHHVAQNGLESLSSMHAFYGFAGHFPLLELLERRLADGAPGPAPVPPFSDAAVDEVAQRLRLLTGQLRGAKDSAAQSRVIAAFELDGWQIVLEDDRSALPHGSYCAVFLVPPDTDEIVDVMMVDAWNPPTRMVVDGDAFAFGRFLDLLRRAILRNNLDTILEYNMGDEEEQLEADDAAPRLKLELSEWLLFGLPDVGDCYLVDWRGQWHVVNAGEGIEAFKAIYGFGGAYLERLARYHIPQWRRFLVEHIDRRFAYSE
jgi:hypothetical protein